MGELWRDLVNVLQRRPALWVPVLVADLLGYLLNVVRNSSLRALVLHATAQRSALDGAVVHAPLSGSAMQSTTILALLLSWLIYFLHMLLYSAALIATAALVRGGLQRRERAATTVGSTLGANWGGMLELALRGLAVYAVAALLFGWLAPFLNKNGQSGLVHSFWFNYLIGLGVLLILAWLLTPAALRVVSGRLPKPPAVKTAQAFAGILVFVSSLLAAFVSANSRELSQVSPGARYPLEIFGSLVAALPYVLLFTGLALLAYRAVDGDEEEAAESA